MVFGMVVVGGGLEVNVDVIVASNIYFPDWILVQLPICQDKAPVVYG